jgi:hypothetical protein
MTFRREYQQIAIWNNTSTAHPDHLQYDKQDKQGKAAFNERNPHMTQQQEPMARSPGGPKQKQDRAKTERWQVNH